MIIAATEACFNNPILPTNPEIQRHLCPNDHTEVFPKPRTCRGDLLNAMTTPHLCWLTIVLLCLAGGLAAGPASPPLATAPVQPAQPAAAPTIGGCQVLPADNIWNTRVDNLPVDGMSNMYVNSIGASAHVHADFGSGVWPPGSTSPIGIPFVVVPGSQPMVNVDFVAWPGESDPGPYPIPPNAPIEGGPASTGDRHVLVLDQGNCTLYEMANAFPNSDGSWNANCGAVFNLNSDALRPATWTSADAAGLPILPGLVRFDEVASGAITHALRFTAPQTQDTFVWPARHQAGSANTSLPPMGERFRLKASYDISGFDPQVQVILQALKTYGMILADNGSAWYLSGAPDERWNNDILHTLGQVPGSAFEAVDESALMSDPNSGRAGPPIIYSHFAYLPLTGR